MVGHLSLLRQKVQLGLKMAAEEKGMLLTKLKGLSGEQEGVLSFKLKSLSFDLKVALEES